jgi:hypothetical protein
MTEEERFKIISNDYMDLMVEYNLNTKLFDRYPNATNHIINDKFAILYVPQSQVTARSFRQYGYSILPAVYGLVSEKSLEATGIQKLRIFLYSI